MKPMRMQKTEPTWKCGLFFVCFTLMVFATGCASNAKRSSYSRRQATQRQSQNLAFPASSLPAESELALTELSEILGIPNIPKTAATLNSKDVIQAQVNKGVQTTLAENNEQKITRENNSSTEMTPLEIARATPTATPDPMNQDRMSQLENPPVSQGMGLKNSLTEESQVNSPVFKSIPVIGPENIGQDVPQSQTLKTLRGLETNTVELSGSTDTPLFFDLPVTYNARVQHWVHYFQTKGRKSFKKYLERSTRFLPLIQAELYKAGLPQDLGYIAMVESGFSNAATSEASAVGLWQFIEATGNRYGLKTSWWLDERRDYVKATRAAIGYMSDLYNMFGSWYLVAASYNMGEARVRRLVEKHRTTNFWTLADKGVIAEETTQYVPKILAAMLISKAPALYGFRELQNHLPQSYEYFHVPGGTDLLNLANYLGVSGKYLKDLNPELIKGFVPRGISSHMIRIPKGSMLTVSQYIRLQMSTTQN